MEKTDRQQIKAAVDKMVPSELSEVYKSYWLGIQTFPDDRLGDFSTDFYKEPTES